MADIQSAAQWIGRLLVEEARYLYKVEDKVKELQDELEWMQCFLRAADASQFDNAMARKWVAQIREFAYQAEDMIEKFLVRVVPHSGGRADLLSMVKKYSRVLWEIRAVHQIGSDIDKLKDKISALSSKLHTYGIEVRVKGSLLSGLLDCRDGIYYNFKEEEIIGRKKDVEELVEELVNPESSPVIAICGEGGVGKTFLAKEIFNNPTIRRKFNSFSWAYVSQPCQISYLQQELLSSLTSKSIEQITQLTDDELKDGLYKAALRTWSLIVLDGVWGTKVWDDLKTAFPITNPGFSSKLLLTTQIDEVAKYAAKDVYIHSLKPLDDVACCNLLIKKLGHVHARISTEKDGLAKKLLDRWLELCRGLPLLIVVLGGVLATKKTLEEWEMVDKNINSYLLDHHEQQWRCILELSYYELPYQLKPCFLFLGYFPTNLQISTRKITNLWEAEGLVSSAGDDETEDTLQGIAEHCLAQLVERSLVQVGSRGLTGKAKTCQLHELMRQLSMSKASKVNWLNVVQLGDEPEQELPGTSSSSSFPSKSSKPAKSSRSAQRKYRRLAIYCSDTLDKLPSDYRLAKYIRSLLFFNTLKGEDVLMPMKRKALMKAFTDFKLLRVVDIENIRTSKLPKEVGFLIHLRYLSLKGSWVSKLPSTIKYLRCLQTFDLRVLSFVRLRIPNVLYRLNRLIHLYLPPKSFVVGQNAEKLQLKGLHNLETLSNFSSMCQAADLQWLTNLRKFTSCDFLRETECVRHILGSPSFNSGHLEHIVLRLDGQILKEQGDILANCKHLRKLWVNGEIARPIKSIVLPANNIIQLTFRGSKFLDDPMPVLGKLPKLQRLSLEHASYEGSKMRCFKGGFIELMFLTLQGLEGLEEWEVEQGAMPKLQWLEINGCWKLKMIPEGLSFVVSLQELEISYMPLSFYQDCVPDPENSWEKWRDSWKVKHIPCVKISHVMASSLTAKLECLDEA